MPISYALLLCIPIGLLCFFWARWLLRFHLGRYEGSERRAALSFGAFGALSIPLLYCAGLIRASIPGKFGEFVGAGSFAIIAMGLTTPFVRTLIEARWRSFGRGH